MHTQSAEHALWHWLQGMPLLVLITLLVLASCRSSFDTSTGMKPAATMTAAPPMIPSQTVDFHSGDGTALTGTLYGHGTTILVLANQGENDPNLWRPIALHLAMLGYLVFSFTYRDTSAMPDKLASDALNDTYAAFAFMRARHPVRLVGLGASLGGIMTIKLADSAHLDALIALAVPIGYQNVQISDADLEPLTMPKLFLVSVNNEPFTSATEHLYIQAPQPKEFQIFQGNEHGLAILSGDSGTALLATITTFLSKCVPAQ